jgi:iron(III) transport system substrate-binding protein
MKRVVVITALLLTSCDSGPRPEPVVVYAHGEETPGLTKRLAEFTEDSGIPVTVKYGDSGALTNNVIRNQGSPPADVLLTGSVGDIWRAADRGALRPIQSAALDGVPEFAKDPDGYWVAFDTYLAAIGKAKKSSSGPDGYAALANQDLKGQLCLSSSALPINRAVIADLISERGAKEAETIVRGWVRNLALPPFQTEEKLIAALQSGACAFGIVSSTYKTDGIEHSSLRSPSYNIEGLGVVRHARYPESAQLLVDWLIEHDTSAMHDHTGRNIVVVGLLDEDVRLLTERAGYR